MTYAANRYDKMMQECDAATEMLEELRALLSERDEAVGIIEIDPSDPDNPTVEPLDNRDAGIAINALAAVFEIVKSLAEESAIELPSEPLPLPDGVLVTILANASLAHQAMRADIKWMDERMQEMKA